MWDAYVYSNTLARKAAKRKQRFGADTELDLEGKHAEAIHACLAGSTLSLGGSKPKQTANVLTPEGAGFGRAIRPAQ